MENPKSEGYYELWKKKFTPANLKKAAEIRHMKEFRNSHNVDLIRQRTDDKHGFVILYGKPRKKENVEYWKNKK